MRDLGLSLDEEVIWSGAPSPFRFAMEAIPTVQLGCFWLIGGVLLSLFAFQIEAAADERWPCYLPLLCSLVGLGMLTAFPIRYLRAKRLMYYMTSGRALVYDRARNTVEAVFSFDDYPSPSVLLRKDGSCDIVFAVDERHRSPDSTELENSASIVRHGLIGIENGASAADALYALATDDASIA